MSDLIFTVTRPLFELLGPERSHTLAISALKSGLHPRQSGRDDPRLAMKLWDLDFPNPLGIAAGFDKNAEVPDPLLKLGFGFVEAGTVTPLAQEGNPRPRMFRLSDDDAVINRLGFNNQGHDRALERLQRRRENPGIIGVNIGANKDSVDRIEDYVAGIKAFHGVVDYFTINISSPNTPGLRDLQSKDALSELVKRVLDARAQCAQKDGRKIPVLVKIAPDQKKKQLENIAEICLNAQIDGVIISNTTITRDDLLDPQAFEEGGLSGGPLFALSTSILARFYLLTQGRIPLIGVGGIDSAETAYAKIRAGASLLQLYTGLVYQGLGLIDVIKTGLVDHLAKDGHQSLSEVVGKDAKIMAPFDT